jgi:hypothetical protein
VKRLDYFAHSRAERKRKNENIIDKKKRRIRGKICGKKKEGQTKNVGKMRFIKNLYMCKPLCIFVGRLVASGI